MIVVGRLRQSRLPLTCLQLLVLRALHCAAFPILLLPLCVSLFITEVALERRSQFCQQFSALALLVLLPAPTLLIVTRLSERLLFLAWLQ